MADIGTYASRIGYAGDDLPRAYFPTVFSLHNCASLVKNLIIDIRNLDL